MKVILSCLLISFIFVSCASMGTTQKIYVNKPITYMKNIGIGYYTFNNLALSDLDNVYPVFDSSFQNYLKRSNQFQKVVCQDSLLDILKLNKQDSLEAIITKAKDKHFDAIIICNLRLMKSYYNFIPMHDAEVTISLYDTENNLLILETTFSTVNGKSYFLPPNRQTIICDAIDGAVNAFVNNFKKNNEN